MVTKKKSRSVYKLKIKSSKTRKHNASNDPICSNYFKSISFDTSYNLLTDADIHKYNVHTKSEYSPKKDFYTYINYGWLEQHKNIPENKYYSQIDSFRVVQEKVNYELIDIVNTYIKTNKTSKSEQVKALYNSLLHEDPRMLKSHMTNTMQNIDDMTRNGTLYELLANFNKNEIIAWQSPIVFTVEVDDKDVSTCRCKLNEPILSIYDYTIYVSDPADTSEDGIYKRKFKEKYLSFIDQLFDSCLGKHHGLSSHDVWDIENILLNAMACDRSDVPSEYYNKMNVSKSLDYGLDWKRFSKDLGFDKPPSFYISGNPDYIKCIMNELTSNWKTKKWITYYKYIHLKQMIVFDVKLYELYYEFFKHYVEGSQAIYPKPLRPIISMSLCFNEMLTDEYVSKNNNTETNEMVNIMCRDLLEVFKKILNKNDWLSPSTKKYALQKLDKINIVIARPEKIQSDPNIRYDNKDVWGNMLKVTQWRYKEMVKREGKSSIEYSRIDWRYFKLSGKQCYIVNAFYTPTENSIYVPLAYLQKPFIDPYVSGGIERNLSTIGYTLAHEMSHSLDDMGSKYDYKGNMKNWWTEMDRTIFNKKINDVVKQYESTALKDGIKLDGTLSTGENLADISGLAICTEYLKLYHDFNEYPKKLSYLSYRLFYTYIAIANRQKIYHDALKSQLKINPHPFNKYRTNCPLVRIKMFRTIMDIKEKDKMYWRSNDIIW